ncbi:probable cytochrome P450 305a1 isoform X2 [Adelges cooleyi]|uniref:probable cytochrome P450 305a1 isoform X2 n=1 Tax=Adelges cooleyi TaxID=133065 RepID=UPI00217F3FB8|nr:probable cytochrome P450 305a1 isoform X2 [Adelges cooleyi]
MAQSILWYLVCLVIGAVLLAVYLTCRKPKNYPPGPPWMPFVGNTYQLANLSATSGGQYKAFEKLRLRYNSDVIGLKLGCEYVVVVFGDALISDTLHREGPFLGRPDNFFMRLRTMGERRGITMTDGDLWKVHRAFVVKHLKSLGLGQRRTDEMIRDEYEQMTRGLMEEAGSITPSPHLQSAIMNILWEFIAGTKFDEPKILQLMSRRSAAFGMAGGLLNQMPWLRHVAPAKSGYSLIMDINQQLFSIISEKIEEHKKTLTDNIRDFIDAYLLRMQQEDKSNTTFTEKQLIAVFLDLFIAGSKTTSSTLDFAILAMAKWPDVQTKVRATLDEIQPPGIFLTAEETLRNRYLKAVLLESKRISHVTPTIGPRRVLNNTKIDAYDIPKGTTILMSLHSIHHNRSRWDDPEVFRPERFIEEDGDIKSGDNMYFFGFGKRRCPGEALAQRFVTLVFANLVHDFEIKIEELPKGVNCGILLTPKPYKIKLSKRK